MACSSTGSAGPGLGQPPNNVLRSLPLLVFEHQPTTNETTKTAISHDDHVPEILMFSISEERIYTEARPAMLSPEDKSCCTTPQGWIFVSQDAPPWETWLWHPLTGDTIPLPPIQDDHYIPNNCSCFLTHSSAAHPDCAVVLLDISDPDMWFCRINGGSSRAWGQHRYNVGEYTLPDKDGDEDSAPTKRIIPPVVAALGGKLHFVFSESNNQYEMGVVDLDFSTPSPTAELRTLEGVDAATSFPEGMYSGVLWLVESEGELFQLSVCFMEFDADDIGDVLVHKMDFDGDRRWHRVQDIGDRVFMLSRGGNAASCSASACNLPGNRVYFMNNFLKDDGDLCIYDLKEQVMEILAVHERDLALARTKPYWIVPPA